MSLENLRVAVVGLGGCGEKVAKELQESLGEQLSTVCLDWNSEIFGEFFFGYESDVYPRIESWVNIDSRDLLSWVDVNSRHSPLREIPDIFMRSASRPIMRASLLLHQKLISDYLEGVLEKPSKVVLVTSTDGRTGSAWVLDIAEMIKQLLPETLIEISLVYNFSARIDRTKFLFHKTYWTLKEILACTNSKFEVRIHSSAEESIQLISDELRGLPRSEDKTTLQEAMSLALKEAELGRENLNSSWRFWRERARSAADLLTEETKDLIAGYALAVSEGRSTGFRDGKTLEFTCQQTGHSHKINFIFESASDKNDSFGRLPMQRGYGLALIPYENSDILQVEAYETICAEGSRARIGQLSTLSATTTEALTDLAQRLKENLNQLLPANGSMHWHSYKEILPHYINLIEQILKNNKS